MLTGAAIQAPQVSAQERTFEYIVYNDTIYVNGRILPKHTVIVDSNNRIKEVASNTTENVVPVIYREQVAPDTQVALSNEIYAQYKSVVPQGSSKAGILYKANEPTSSNKSGLSIMSVLINAALYKL
jgi:hypothetical protein